MVVSSTPQREINSVAYSLSWSRCNDFFFLTSGVLKACPVWIRRPGPHCHQKGASLGAGVSVV